MTNVHLTYVPLNDSIHVYLNGIEQQEDVDWVFDGPLNRVEVAADEMPGDLVECLYAHEGVLSPPPDVTFIDSASHGGVNPTLTSFDPPEADDLLFLVVGFQNGGSMTTPSGFSQYGSDITQFNITFRIFQKLAAGGETSVGIIATGPPIATGRVVASLAIIRGGIIKDVSGITHAFGSPQPIPVGSGYGLGEMAVVIACIEQGVVDGRVSAFPAPYTTVVAASESASGSAGVQSGNGKLSIGVAVWQSDGNDNPAGNLAATGSVNNMDIRTVRVGV